MRIIHLSAECYPAAKVGGLADVVGALPKYQMELGNEVAVCIPYYDNKYFESHSHEVVFDGWVPLGPIHHAFKVLKIKDDNLGFTLFAIAVQNLLDRPNVYSYWDDPQRFIVFQKVALNWMRDQYHPEIIHCHDHHTGLIPFFTRYGIGYEPLSKTPTLLTIHNGEYQGWFGKELVSLLPPFHENYLGLLEWGEVFNPLASAIRCAWRVTTVSPSYMQELQHSAKGLEGLLRMEASKCLGIINGIDSKVWNPETDPMLEANYDKDTVAIGKNKNKQWLCDTFQLDPDVPIFAFIGRLVHEKGADLLPQIAHDALKYNQDRLNIIMLGSGDPNVERGLESIKHFFPGHYNTYIGYNEALSHKIYAGADFLLMPSRVEPCGLNQLYSLRYGTLPIVRRTGGLQDTVIDIGDGGFGIRHDQASVWDVTYSIRRALDLYQDYSRFKKLQSAVMEIDHSWEHSAQKYLALYKSLIPN